MHLIEQCVNLCQESSLKEIELQYLDKLFDALKREKKKSFPKSDYHEIKKWTDKIISSYGTKNISDAANKFAKQICRELNIALPISISETASQQFMSASAASTSEVGLVIKKR